MLRQRSTKVGRLIPTTRGCPPTRKATATALNEGREVNPDDTDWWQGHLVAAASLNEGREVNPDDTWPIRRSASPWAWTLNEGREVNPDDTG